jgi:anthraniloyl-CoA monooxygenase
MFTPFTLRGMTLTNRVVVSPMCTYSATDGMPGDFHFQHYTARGLGGAALVMTEMTCVSADARISPGCAGIWTDAQAAAWKRITGFVHANSQAKMGMQIGHAGRKGSTRLGLGWHRSAAGFGQLAADRAVAVAYIAGVSQIPKEMTRRRHGSGQGRFRCRHAPCRQRRL